MIRIVIEIEEEKTADGCRIVLKADESRHGLVTEKEKLARTVAVTMVTEGMQMMHRMTGAENYHEVIQVEPEAPERSGS